MISYSDFSHLVLSRLDVEQQSPDLDIGPQTDLVELGLMTSVKLLQILILLEDKLDVELKLADDSIGFRTIDGLWRIYRDASEPTTEYEQ